MTTALESSELDARSIAAGIPSRALMQRAGAAAAAEILGFLRQAASCSVVIYAGSGNNGGDGWVVARSLAAAGVDVDVVAVGETRTGEARSERALAEAEPLVRVLSFDEHAADATHGTPSVVVDALLGTGARGAPRASVARAIALVARARERGAMVVSLDIPSGVDADSGVADHAVRADVTLTFGTIKRGLLVARGSVGRIILLDIGLVHGREGDATNDVTLVDARWVRSLVPPFAADAHKGTRKKLVIVGGQLGMAGAPVLAARAAMRSGIGMVRLVVAPESLAVVQGTEPHALARAWPVQGAADWDDAIGSWADAVLIGPGLGASSRSREMVEQALRSWIGPVVLDADALNVFAGEPELLGKLLDGRPALLTPHVAEFARLSGYDMTDVLERRFDVGVELSRRVGAAVLLKGLPTVVAAADGAR
ncbi:MAG TPA: NAD(P)H-hydrate epimerase, partial [Gemmatimonadaceae bacterium]